MSLVIWWYNQGNAKRDHRSKDKRTLLKVVRDYYLSPMSTVCYIAKREKGLQSLSSHFGRVSVR